MNISNNSNKNGLNRYKSYIWLSISILFYLILSRISPPTGLSVEGWKAILLMISAIIIWVSECIPLGVASCILLFVPELLNISKTGDVMKNFGISTMFFIISSSIIARAFINTGLGNRISLYITTIFGKRSKMVLLSYMICAGIISSVLADIPTTIILASIAFTLLKKNNMEPMKSNFGKAIMMGIPMAAALGGFATPVGSGVNILAIDLMKKFGKVDISFVQWTAIGFPLAIVMILVTWFILIHVLKPEVEELKGLDNIKEERKKLGKLNANEKKFSFIFSITIILWCTNSITGLDLTFVSLATTMVLFLPKIDLMNWKEAEKNIGWAGVLLVGASNALAMILSEKGSAEWLSNTFLSGFANSSLIILLLIISAFGLFIHFLIPVANAVLTVSIPIIAVLAVNAGINPIYLILPIAYTSKAIFLLPLDPIPLATYDYGYWKLVDMPKIGVLVSIVWIPIMAGFIVLAKGIGII